MHSQGLEIKHLIIIDTDIKAGRRKLADLVFRDLPSILANLPGLLREDLLKLESPAAVADRIRRWAKSRVLKAQGQRQAAAEVAFQPEAATAALPGSTGNDGKSRFGPSWDTSRGPTMATPW